MSIDKIRVVEVIGRGYCKHSDTGGFCNDTAAEYDIELAFDVASMKE